MEKMFQTTNQTISIGSTWIYNLNARRSTQMDDDSFVILGIHVPQLFNEYFDRQRGYPL